jgi:extracellular elastinolytic metalloproteinase
MGLGNPRAGAQPVPTYGLTQPAPASRPLIASTEPPRYNGLMCAVLALAGLLAACAPVPGPVVDGDMTQDPRAIAIEYLRQHAEPMGLSQADLADLVAIGQNVVRPSGVTNVHLRQRYKGIEVAGAEVNVLVAKDGRVLNTGGSFISNLASAVNEPAHRISAADAVRAAAKALGLQLREPIDVIEEKGGPAAATTLGPGGIASASIPAHLVFHRTGPDRARLAWILEIDRPDGRHWWVMTVDAETGEVLEQADRVLQGGSAG